MSVIIKSDQAIYFDVHVQTSLYSLLIRMIDYTNKHHITLHLFHILKSQHNKMRKEQPQVKFSDSHLFELFVTSIGVHGYFLCTGDKGHTGSLSIDIRVTV